MYRGNPLGDLSAVKEDLHTSSNKSSWAVDNQTIRDMESPMAEPAARITGTAATKANGPFEKARTATVGR
jgi:hypothetical protein